MDSSSSRREMIKLNRISEAAIVWIGSVTSLIVHTLLFIGSFMLSIFHIVPFQEMLLVLTTIVSLEAIYLSIFIQMSVNKSNQFIEIIHEDVGEISEDVGEIHDNVDEISENIEDIQDDESSKVLNDIEETLLLLHKEVSALKKNLKPKK